MPGITSQGLVELLAPPPFRPLWPTMQSVFFSYDDDYFLAPLQSPIMSPISYIKKMFFELRTEAYMYRLTD